MSRVGLWCSGLRFGDIEAARSAAAEAEELGYREVWLLDAGGADLFDRLSALLETTERLIVATGVLNLWMHEADDVIRNSAALEQIPLVGSSWVSASATPR